MQKLKLTIVAQLHEGSSRCLIEYMEAYRGDYGKALREAFYAVRRGGLNKSKYNTYLQHKYGITKRTADSIIFDAQGRFNALKELKGYERKQSRAGAFGQLPYRIFVRQWEWFIRRFRNRERDKDVSNRQ